MGIMGVAIDLFLANGFPLGASLSYPWTGPYPVSWDFSDGIGYVGDRTDRRPKSDRGIFWHLERSFRFCAWFCWILLSLGWLALLANAHKVGARTFRSQLRIWQGFKFVIRFTRMIAGLEALHGPYLKGPHNSAFLLEDYVSRGSE